MPSWVVADFYSAHRGQSFFSQLLEFMSSGTVIALALERENAVAALRERIGATDPAAARPGTLRAMFGTRMPANAIHGSESPAYAAFELQLFFGVPSRWIAAGREGGK